MSPCPCFLKNGYPVSEGPHPDCRVHRERPPKSSGKGNPLLRGAGLKSKSDKQKIRDAFLMGVKAERIRGMIWNFGEPKCEECGRAMIGNVSVGREVELSEYVESCMELLDGHHVKPRDSGPPYKAWNDHGIDTPANIKLLCRACHEATEPSPQFGHG